MARFKTLESANKRIDLLTDTLKRLVYKVELLDDNFCKKLYDCQRDKAVRERIKCRGCSYKRAKKVLGH